GQVGHKAGIGQVRPLQDLDVIRQLLVLELDAVEDFLGEVGGGKESAVVVDNISIKVGPQSNLVGLLAFVLDLVADEDVIHCPLGGILGRPGGYDLRRHGDAQIV